MSVSCHWDKFIHTIFTGSFGLVCYVKSFIRSYSEDVALLTTMINQEKTTGKAMLEWSSEATTALANLKRNLMNPLSLHSIDLHAKNSEIHVFVDSSCRSYGCVLYQKFLPEKEGDKPTYKLIDYYGHFQTLNRSIVFASIQNNLYELFGFKTTGRAKLYH